MKVIRINKHLNRGDVVYEYLCPPDCPECRAEAKEFVRGTDGKLHLTKIADLVPPRVKLNALYCRKCNRWGDHDETWNHGD